MMRVKLDMRVESSNCCDGFGGLEERRGIFRYGLGSCQEIALLLFMGILIKRAELLFLFCL
jgi:hypothetical protein